MLGNEPDIEIIGSAGDGQEAVDLSDKLLPDVVLMDTSMPKLNGIEATRIIHNNHPEICIIGLSMFEEVERAQAMREAGAADYVTKSGAAEKLMSAIRAAIKASPKEAAAGTNL
jgi:DNA-binding NarL/FixJ family response regulator